MSQEFAYKQALIIRLDLKIGRGKIAVQCSHAAVSAAEEARIRFPQWWKGWLEDGQRKIALKVHDLDALLNLENVARRNRLPVYLVRDRGLTQVPPDTFTCVGRGPAQRLSQSGDKVRHATRDLFTGQGTYRQKILIQCFAWLIPEYREPFVNTF